MFKIVSGLLTNLNKHDVFDDIEEIKQKCITDKNLYLVYNEEEEHKIYLDIDVKKHEYEQLGSYEEVKEDLLKEINETFSIYEGTISIAESSQKDYKISYHVVINGYKLKIKTMKKFIIDVIKNNFNEKYKNFIDESVYNKNGKIRLPYCSKDGQNRPLNIIQGKFKDFITCYLENANLIDYNVDETFEQVEEKSTELFDEVSDKEIKEILLLLPSKYYDDFNLWFRIGAILKSINKLELFKEFSKQSNKYNEKYLMKLWSSLSVEKITINSLYYYLKKENPDKFCELMKDKYYNFSEYDTARLFYKIKPNNYLYSNNVGWYSLNTKTNIWHNDHHEPSILLNDISSTISKYYSNIINGLNKTDVKEALKIGSIMKFLVKSIHTSKFISGVIKFLKNFYTIQDLENIMDENKNLIAFNNGIYDLEKSEFRNIKPTDYISLTTGYDLDINSNKNVRKEILNFINSCFDNLDTTNYLLKTIAYGLTGSNKYEEFYIWTGQGGNGKGTINKFIERCLGNYYNVQSIEVFTKSSKQANQHDTLGEAKGRRFLIATEPEQNDNEKLNIAKLNLCSGNDIIKTREIHKKAIAYKPQFTIYIQCNMIPELSSIGESIKRRLRIINFPFNFKENPILNNERKSDPTIKSKIETNDLWRNEFMLLLIDYYNQYIRDEKSIPQAQQVKEITNEYLDDNNKLMNWIKENYETTNNKNDKIKNTDFYNQYLNDTRDHKTTKKSFYSLCLFNKLIEYKDLKTKSIYYLYLKRKNNDFVDEENDRLVI